MRSQSEILIYSHFEIQSQYNPLFPMPSILLIEDDIGIVTPLQMYLEQSEFSVIHCPNGIDALSQFQKEKPSVVILDINLPGKSGIEVC